MADCQVCGETMDKERTNYGGVTCGSCRSFFRRMSCKGMDAVCFDSGNCQITPSNRIVCKPCRFEKCLKIGMDLYSITFSEQETQQYIENDAGSTSNMADTRTGYNGSSKGWSGSSNGWSGSSNGWSGSSNSRVGSSNGWSSSGSSSGSYSPPTSNSGWSNPLDRGYNNSYSQDTSTTQGNQNQMYSSSKQMAGYGGGTPQAAQRSVSVIVKNNFFFDI